MRRMTYAEAAAGAAGTNSDHHQQQQQASTGTSPSLCSAESSRDYGKDGRFAASRGSSREDLPSAGSLCFNAAHPAISPVGANPGTVKFLKERYERQGSENGLTNVPRLRLPSSAQSFSSSCSAGAPRGAESRNSTDDAKHWEVLADAEACAEIIKQLLLEKQQLQQQVDYLWNQKEAFRCANERMSKVLLRQQQQPAAALAAAAEAVGATPRKDLARRCVTVVPSGCLTARGPVGPRLNLGALREKCEDRAGLVGVKEHQRQNALQHPPEKGKQPKKPVPLPQKQQNKLAGIPGMAPLNLEALQRSGGSHVSGAVATANTDCRGLPSRSLRTGGPLTCRAPLAWSALKTPRRRFGDGVISARASSGTWQRRGPGDEEEQQHRAIEKALITSLRSMNILGSFGRGGANGSRKCSKTAAGANWEPTPEVALTHCTSTPDKGFWHSTFLCVLKIEGTDFFLDAVQQPLQQQHSLRHSHSSASKFLSSLSLAADPADGHAMNGARILASKETAGVFEVCVRHLLTDDNWVRSLCISMYWGLTSVVDPAELPPDQTLQHGLSMDETQAGALEDRCVSSITSESGREEEEMVGGAGDSNGKNKLWSGWDLVALMYQRSIDAGGTPIPGKEASPSTGLYVSSRVPDASEAGSSPSGSSSTGSTITKNSSNKNNDIGYGLGCSSTTADMRRAEPYSAMNQLLLQKGPAAEQVFIVRAKDRHTGVMPLFHRSTQKYLHVHPTMGLVGLVPPVIEQEKQMRLLQKSEHQHNKRSRRRLKARTPLENLQQQQEGSNCNVSSSDQNTAETKQEPVTPDMFLRPCRVEMIPLADLLLQQSVQRLLSSVQETVPQKQPEETSWEGSGDTGPKAPADSASSCSHSRSSSDQEDSFDGVVASEGVGSLDLGSCKDSRHPLVPPLGFSSTVAQPTCLSPAQQQPVTLEFHLDDEGVDTDMEGEGVRRCGSDRSSDNKTAYVDVIKSCLSGGAEGLLTSSVPAAEAEKKSRHLCSVMHLTALFNGCIQAE
ncbi:uncharacterized protein LOC34617833 [Cyclospora cayetanensis]|uniref:Uncharacterized protein LOC34617833 n=1 Tax=Cyclospora cayetanensis TaxID=88456 RepID=A0A6P6S3Y4_9EIME|nr:uncharacterized protein LOC34617833 [Cyclospora cayetanensis]